MYLVLEKENPGMGSTRGLKLPAVRAYDLSVE
jgi:hypothetical protein